MICKRLPVLSLNFFKKIYFLFLGVPFWGTDLGYLSLEMMRPC